MQVTEEARKKFQKMFRVPVTTFVSRDLGFLTWKFEAWLDLPEDARLLDYLKSHYNEETSNLVKQLKENDETVYSCDAVG